MSARSIERELNESAPELLRLDPLPNEWKKANRLEFFFEDPSPYMTRQWSPTSQAIEYQNYGLIKSLQQVWFNTPPINEILYSAGRSTEGVLAQRLLRVDSGPFTAHIPSRGHPRLASYLYSMLLNRGVFAGFAAREYFAGLFERYLYQKLDTGNIYVEKKPGSTVTFKDFLNMTGVDLVVTGTNLSKRSSCFFSVGATPDFPVAEAVGISMNIPIMFKPILIDRPVVESLGASDPYNEQYVGLWVDGGMLMNYPLHAFDRLESNTLDPNNPEPVDIAVPPDPNELYEFRTDMLGFRLVEKTAPPFDADEVYKSDIGVMGSLMGDLMETFMFGGAEGQIRSIDERRATIELDISGLSVTDFAGPIINRIRAAKGMLSGQLEAAELKEKLIAAAYRSTKDKLTG